MHLRIKLTLWLGLLVFTLTNVSCDTNEPEILKYIELPIVYRLNIRFDNELEHYKTETEIRIRLNHDDVDVDKIMSTLYEFSGLEPDKFHISKNFNELVIRSSNNGSVGENDGPGIIKIKEDNDFQFVFTEFGPGQTNTLFPCFDDPKLYSTFDLTLYIPRGYSTRSLTKMTTSKVSPDEPNVVEFNFRRTWPMSPDQFGFIVAPLDKLSHKRLDPTSSWPVDFYGKPGDLKATLIIRTGKAIENAEARLRLKYLPRKLDIIMLPHFSKRRMIDKPGLIVMAPVEQLSATQLRRDYTVFIHHIIYRQILRTILELDLPKENWFLEGLSKWFSSLSLEAYVKYSYTEFFVANYRSIALTKFYDEDAPNIRDYFYNAPANLRRSILDISTAFKAEAIVQMLNEFCRLNQEDHTMETILASTRYFEMYIAGARNDLVFKDVINSIGNMCSIDFHSFIEPWLNKKGIPLIEVDYDRLLGTLVIKQRDISSNDSYGFTSESDNTTWPIPVSYAICTSDSCHQNYKISTGHGPEKIDTPEGKLTDEHFIIANYKQHGFYRTKYSDRLLNRVCKALNSDSLSAHDKLIIVDDAWALSKIGRAGVYYLMKILDCFPVVTARTTQNMPIAPIKDLWETFRGTKYEFDITKFCIEKIHKVPGSLSYTPYTMTEVNGKKFEASISDLLIDFKDIVTLKDLYNKIDRLRENNPNETFRSIMYTAAIYDQIEYLIEVFEHREELRDDISKALGRAPNIRSLELAWNFLKTKDTPLYLKEFLFNATKTNVGLQFLSTLLSNQFGYIKRIISPDGIMEILEEYCILKKGDDICSKIDDLSEDFDRDAWNSFKKSMSERSARVMTAQSLDEDKLINFLNELKLRSTQVAVESSSQGSD